MEAVEVVDQKCVVNWQEWGSPENVSCLSDWEADWVRDREGQYVGRWQQSLPPKHS